MRSLPDLEIHIHTVPLTADGVIQDQSRQVLSADELRRVDRYRSDVAREEFIVSHAALRCVLAGYLSCSPAEVEYAHGQNGKPELAGAPAATDWRFNLSHSRGMAAIAVSAGSRLGVDIENGRGFSATDGLAKSILSERELHHYSSLPDNQQGGLLLRAWTLKEALVKGIGIGLMANPQQIEFDLSGPGSPRLVSTGIAGERAASWRTELPIVGGDYTLAVATDATDRSLRLIPHGVQPWLAAANLSELF